MAGTTNKASPVVSSSAVFLSFYRKLHKDERVHARYYITPDTRLAADFVPIRSGSGISRPVVGKGRRCLRAT